MTSADQVQHERAVELAQTDLDHIGQLVDSDPFQKYYVRRLKERMQNIRNRIADEDNLSDAETKALRMIVKEYASLLSMPGQDAVAHRATIANARQVHTGPSRG